jgi:hypothetical protein
VNRRAIVAGSFVATAVLTWAALSTAFVPLVTASCNRLRWAQTCVYVTADSAGVADMPLADVERIAGQAIQGWRARTDASTFLRMSLLPASGPREVANDGWQVVKFRSTTWCRPADATTPEVCYDASATAITTVTYVSDPSDPANDGRILDADIELNAVHNYFYDADANPSPDPGTREPLDLWNTLAHELGHLQGLDHPCSGRSATELPSCARDGAAQPIPSCDDVEAGKATDPRLAAIFAATMYPSTTAGETEKRAPKDDDVAGIESAYPMSMDPQVCAMPPAEDVGAGQTPAAATAKTGCSMASGGVAGDAAAGKLSSMGMWLLLSAVAVLVLRLRRGRRGLVVMLAASTSCVPGAPDGGVVGAGAEVIQATRALTAGGVTAINGTYGAGCFARAGPWSVLVSGTDPLPNPVLSVVRNNGACALTLTSIVAGSTYAGTPAIAMTTAYRDAASAFPSSGPVSF